MLLNLSKIVNKLFIKFTSGMKLYITCIHDYIHDMINHEIYMVNIINI